jgi:hypothetical protein
MCSFSTIRATHFHANENVTDLEIINSTEKAKIDNNIKDGKRASEVSESK